MQQLCFSKRGAGSFDKHIDLGFLSFQGTFVAQESAGGNAGAEIKDLLRGLNLGCCNQNRKLRKREVLQPARNEHIKVFAGAKSFRLCGGGNGAQNRRKVCRRMTCQADDALCLPGRKQADFALWRDSIGDYRTDAGDFGV